MQRYEWSAIDRADESADHAPGDSHRDDDRGRTAPEAGCVVPEHSHPNEQISMMDQGALRFIIGGEEVIVRAGQAVRIPPNGIPHSAEALEDSLATDLFSPPREDWIRGDDAYLRR
jgi:mannose-6-phosphate isomerase-like protein (cupin superfamily)